MLPICVDDHYNYDESRYEMVGRTHRKVYKLGQEVRVRVADTDRLMRTIDFVIAKEGTKKMAKTNGKMIANNKKAYHDLFYTGYLRGRDCASWNQVKSLRMGKCSIKESFIRIENGEVFIYGMHISPYEKGNIFNKILLRVKRS